MNAPLELNVNDDPFLCYLGLSVVSAENDSAEMKLIPNENTASGIGGAINGGTLATMIDMTGVAAAWSNLRGAVPMGTADLQISYLRQAHGELKAVGRVVKRGRQLCTVLVDVTDSDGKLCATGKVLYSVRPQ